MSGLGFGRWTSCFLCRAIPIVGHLVHWWCHLLFPQCGTICPFGPIFGSMLGGPGPQREHSQELHPLLLRLPSCYSLSSRTTSCHAVYVLGFEASSRGRWWSHAPRISSENLCSVLLQPGILNQPACPPTCSAPAVSSSCHKHHPLVSRRVVPVSPSCQCTACSTCYLDWLDASMCPASFVARPTNYTRCPTCRQDLAPELLKTLGSSPVGTTMEVAGAHPATTPGWHSPPNFVEPSPNQSSIWSSKVSHRAEQFWTQTRLEMASTSRSRSFACSWSACVGLPWSQLGLALWYTAASTTCQCLSHSSWCFSAWQVVGLWAGSYWRVEMFARWCPYEFFRILQRVDTLCFSVVSGPYFSLPSSSDAFWGRAFSICVGKSSLSASSLQSQNSCWRNFFAS